jgi:glycine/D-amino acid oxidase-like deaminating enzyme
MTKIGYLPGDDETCGWLRILPERTPKPALEGDVRADWVVVGAGFSGLAAARRLAENRPNDSIVLLEAQCVGEGASGRNSGFVIDIPHNVGSVDLGNVEAGRRVTRISRAALAYLEDTVTRHQIQCQWSRRGQHMAAVSDRGEAALEPFKKELDRLGEPYRVLDAEETARALGTRYYRSSVHTPTTALMQPAALVRGLADTLPRNVTLHEMTPVREIDYGERIRVTTAKGSVEAAGIILAVNGFAPEFGRYRRKLFLLRAYASITRPLTGAEQKALGTEGDWGILPAGLFGGATLRYTQDRRILFRQTITYATRYRTDPATYATVRAGHVAPFRARFPMLPEVNFEHTWAGFLCLSRNYAPGFGRHAGNVFTAVCQNGVGASKGTAAGMLAADLAAGVDNALIADIEAMGQPVTLPPRPFLDLGARAMLAWWTWRGRHER